MNRRSFLRGSVATAALAFLPAQVRASDDVGLELICACDVSDSVQPDEYRLQLQGLIAAFRSPAVLQAIENTAFGAIDVLVFEWGNEYQQRIQIPWTRLSSAADIIAMTDALARTERSFDGTKTSMDYAVRFAVNQYRRDPNSCRRVLDISGDGRSNTAQVMSYTLEANVANEPLSIEWLDAATAYAVKNGIVINGLPIIGQFTEPELETYYKQHVAKGEGSFVIKAVGSAEFQAAMTRKLPFEIAGLIPGSRFA